MKIIIPSLLAAALAPLASAHYSFSQVVVNGALKGTDWSYVRQHTRGYMPTFRDEAATSTNFRCNQNALSGANTGVLTVNPGDKVALKQAFGGTGMAHPGPTSIYMSRAPGSVKNYDGSGEWFKVFQGLVCRNTGSSGWTTDNWCMWYEDRIEFTMPNLPAGEYLVRAEHIAIHGAHAGSPEFYYACAQLNVAGTASSIPGDKVRIPGVYGANDPAILFSVWNNPSSYPYTPGSAVIPGGTIRGNGSGSSSGIVTVPGGASGGGSSGGGGGGGSCSPMWGQCGGQGYTGPTCCSQGTCTVSNQWYSQCV